MWCRHFIGLVWETWQGDTHSSWLGVSAAPVASYSSDNQSYGALRIMGSTCVTDLLSPCLLLQDSSERSSIP